MTMFAIVFATTMVLFGCLPDDKGAAAGDDGVVSSTDAGDGEGGGGGAGPRAPADASSGGGGGGKGLPAESDSDRVG